MARFVTSIMALAAGACVAQTPPDPERGGLAETIERLSETSGYFDTDNLISNESSYLHVMGILDELDVRGGAYVGVGPDQNFSYMARIRPEVAFIIDVRRDNLLQHLLFKSLFEESVNRLEYLCLLYGRPVPADLPAWSDRDLEDLVQYVDSVDVLSNDADETRARVRNRVDSFAIPLTDADRETIDRFHRTFIRAGLSLRFTTFGRPPRFFYPTHRDLLLAEDLAGRQASFLVLEEDYQFLRDLQLADRVIPVVGNLAGTHALPAIGRMVEDLGTTVSAIYSSNVEFYIWNDRSFPAFAEAVSAFPMDDHGVIIRSHFGNGFSGAHPLSVPGFYSTQLVQRLEDFREAWQGDGFRSYGDLVTRDAVALSGVGR